LAAPGIAQANEHWYVNGTKLAESSKRGEHEVTLKTSGEITYTYGPSFSCEVVQTSKIWNPSGKGNGLGEVTAYEVKSCIKEPTECPKLAIKPESLPWSVEIYEDISKVDHEATKMTLGLYCNGKAVFEDITGTLTPRFINAVFLPPKAAEIDYDNESGVLEAFGSGGFKLSLSGNLKVEGAKEKEKIQVKE
jgi:hypothetical protein